MAMHLSTLESLVAFYLWNTGLEIMAVAYHNSIEGFLRLSILLQVLHLDRPFPVAIRRLQQLDVVQKLKRSRHLSIEITNDNLSILFFNVS